jgi:cytochrome c553
MNNLLFKINIVFISSLLILFSTSVLPEVSGKVIAYACYSCHGKKLKNLELYRPLSAKQLSRSLLAFKYDKKSATIMDRITKGYTNTELKSVAEFISKTD